MKKSRPRAVNEVRGHQIDSVRLASKDVAAVEVVFGVAFVVAIAAASATAVVGGIEAEEDEKEGHWMGMVLALAVNPLQDEPNAVGTRDEGRPLLQKLLVLGGQSQANLEVCLQCTSYKS